MSMHQLARKLYGPVAIAFFIMFLLSFISFLGLISLQSANQKILENGIQVEAEVVSSENDTRALYLPYPKTTVTVHFSANEPIETSFIICATSYDVENTVNISYDPDNPEKIASELTASSIRDMQMGNIFRMIVGFLGAILHAWFWSAGRYLESIGE